MDNWVFNSHLPIPPPVLFDPTSRHFDTYVQDNMNTNSK